MKVYWVETLLNILAWVAWFYAGYWVSDQGFFRPFRWKCPHKKCNFSISTNDEFSFFRVRDNHMMVMHSTPKEARG